MYSENDLKRLSKEYRETEIPAELESMMKNTFKKSGRINMKIKSMIKGLSAAAAALVIFVGALNISPAFAAAAENTPIIGGLARLLIFRAYEDVTDEYALKIDGAKVTGLNNAEIENSLNEKYAAQSRRMYEEFISEVDAGKKNVTLFSNYTIKARTDMTVSIENSLFKSAASSSSELTYDTVDAKNGLYITLPMLFKDDSYIDIISGEIKAQIKKRMADNPDDKYFTDDEAFERIDEHQTFYINNESKLVMVFDKYAIAPGYMGAQEFVIDTELLDNALIGTDYLQ
jgi:hypothetical protein